MNSSTSTESQESPTQIPEVQLMEPISHAELVELHTKFRAVKHSACNALAVVMALSEMAERNPAYVEKLTKTVLSKSPQMVTELRAFDDEFRALLKGLPD